MPPDGAVVPRPKIGAARLNGLALWVEAVRKTPRFRWLYSAHLTAAGSRLACWGSPRTARTEATRPCRSAIDAPSESSRLSRRCCGPARWRLHPPLRRNQTPTPPPAPRPRLPPPPHQERHKPRNRPPARAGPSPLPGQERPQGQPQGPGQANEAPPQVDHARLVPKVPHRAGRTPHQRLAVHRALGDAPVPAGGTFGADGAEGDLIGEGEAGGR